MMPVSFPVKPGYCACGEPLHYGEYVHLQHKVQERIDEHGENVVVSLGSRSWLVQRHYIALHGLRAIDLPGLGFPEIGTEAYVLRP